MSQRAFRGSPRRDRQRPPPDRAPRADAGPGSRSPALAAHDHRGLAQHSDVALVVCIERRRCPEALGELYRRHGGPAHHLAAQVCGPKRATELVADVVAGLWRRPGQFDPDRSSLRSFLLGRVHARAADVARAARAAGSAPAAGAGAPEGATARVERAMAGGMGGHAQRLLSDLGDDDAKALALAYLWGYSCAEIAGMSGRSERAVAASLRGALLSLGSRSVSATR